MPVKTEPTPVMAADGGVEAVTLMKASSSNYRQPARAAPGEILRSPDRMMAALRCRVPYWGHRLWSGAGWKRREVVWCAFSRVDDNGSRQHGAAGSHWWACDDGRAQDGGVVWRRGGVDGS